ncbi:MAG: HU family DNA-binding protein [Planctomycetia bacterium]|nr:MAG: HU family DNA-binding protein [Planctomycetia bacterium]
MAKAAQKKPPTKTEVFTSIANATDLTKKDVAAVFDALSVEIKRSVGRNGPKAFTIPGLCKIVVQHKAATKARKGVNPFTGEATVFKAKPARNVVKVRPLKNLKDMV